MCAKLNSAEKRQGEPDVWAVMRQLLRHPVHSFVTGWNWKAGALSIFLRVPVYIATTFKYGWQATTMAAAVEAVFASAAAGLYAALTEAIRYATPQTAVAVILLVGLPAITVLFDALFHYVMRTPNLIAGVAVSLLVSILSSGFNWYSMRRGTLLVGKQARPFGSDVASLPLLIARFAAEPFVLLWRNLRRSLKFLCAAAVGE